MPLKTHQIETPTLNLTPMIDVVFQLIIFFMVSTQFARLEREIEISLPEVQQVQPGVVTEPKQIVSLTAEGNVMLMDQRVTLHQLRDELASIHQRQPDVEVVIRGDKAGSIQMLGEALDAITAAGIYNIDFAVQRR